MIESSDDDVGEDDSDDEMVDEVELERGAVVDGAEDDLCINKPSAGRSFAQVCNTTQLASTCRAMCTCSTHCSYVSFKLCFELLYTFTMIAFSCRLWQTRKYSPQKMTLNGTFGMHGILT